MASTLEDKKLHAVLSVITNLLLVGKETSTVTFLNDSNISIAENNTSVGTLALNTTDTLIYAISDGNSSLFNINASTGVLTFVPPPDYESGDIFYTFTMTATDSKGNETTQEVTVNITNVAEVTPVLLERNVTKVFTLSDFSFSADASWTDDSNSTYSNAEIKLASSVDSETKNIYTLTTTATKQVGTSNAVDVNISIGDDTNDLYIQSAIYNNNATTITSDDIIHIYFTKSVESTSLSNDKFTLYGEGVIDVVGGYREDWFRYDINLSNSASSLGTEDNISIDNMAMTTITIRQIVIMLGV
jgi:hypothetical protein